MDLSIKIHIDLLIYLLWYIPRFPPSLRMRRGKKLISFCMYVISSVHVQNSLIEMFHSVYSVHLYTLHFVFSCVSNSGTSRSWSVSQQVSKGRVQSHTFKNRWFSTVFQMFRHRWSCLVYCTTCWWSNQSLPQTDGGRRPPWEPNLCVPGVRGQRQRDEAEGGPSRLKLRQW